MFQFEKEFLAILSNFNKINGLKHLVLIGSWVLLVYRENYNIEKFQFTTSDIDFSVRHPRSPITASDPGIHETLTEMGYMPHYSTFTQSEKYIPALDSYGNNLSIEFLCEPGGHIQKAYKIKGLGISATPIPYQKILLEHTESLNYKGIPVNVPGPMYWAIHKIAISQIRSGKDAKLKMIKDLESARVIVDASGTEEILSLANHFKGKFLRLFQKGWDVFNGNS
ncbi:MAG: hypothetical protein GY940_11465 [bacterium]|nr:hypothetical protein [bacterium]